MDPADWEPVDVATELKTIGLGACSKKFVDRGITGMDLYGLDDAKLRQMGLLVGQRVTLLNWIRTLPPPGSSRQRGSGRRGGAAASKPAPAARRGGGVSRPQLGRNAFDDDEPPAPQPKRSIRPAGAPPATKATATAAAASTTAAAKRTARGGASATRAPAGAPGRGSGVSSGAKPAPAAASKPKAAVSRKPNRFTAGPPMNIPEETDNGDRVECRYCGRRFASDRIDKHESICATASKKRRKFDAKKQRLSGTEAASYQRVASKQPQKPAKEYINGKPKYKVEHENLVAALRAARKFTAYEEARQAGKAVGPPPEMPKMQEVPDDRVQCPYCGRKFGEEQFARHERFCSSTNAPIPRISGRTGGARGGRGGATRGARGKRY